MIATIEEDQLVIEPTTASGADSLIAYRLHRLEQELQELVKAMQSSTVTLGAQMTALSNQVGQFQAGLPEYYAPRREANERHANIEQRFGEIDERMELRSRIVDARLKAAEDRITGSQTQIDRLVTLGWGFVSALVITLGTAVIALLRTTPGAPGT